MTKAYLVQQDDTSVERVVMLGVFSTTQEALECCEKIWEQILIYASTGPEMSYDKLKTGGPGEFWLIVGCISDYLAWRLSGGVGLKK
jgi:hypothetical protein